MSPEERDYQKRLAERKSLTLDADKIAAHIRQLDVDRRNWQEVAEQVNAGKWNDADQSTARALYRGLSAFQFPQCVKAAKRMFDIAQKKPKDKHDQKVDSKSH